MFETPNVVGVCVATRSKEDFVSVWNKDDLQMQTRFMIGCARAACAAWGDMHWPATHGAICATARS